MKTLIAIFLITGLMFPVSAQTQKKDKRKKDSVKSLVMQTQIDSVSYAFGMLIGANMQDVGFTQFNFELFTEALKKVLANEPNLIDDEAARLVVNKYVSDLMLVEAEKNLAESLEFLEINSKKNGIVTLSSGLQYQIIEKGTGPLPDPDSRVKVHYTGMLIDGTIFDSSHEQGEPVVVPLNMVIDGWTEALQLMPTGSRWMLYIPPHLGYGESSPQGSPIKPNSALIFDVILIGIEE